MPNSKIDILIQEINKKYGPQTINRVKDLKTLDVEYIPTGSFSLDNAVGRGLPVGRIVELYGVPSSGKSLICALTVAQAQKKGGECVWIDAEQAFDPTFAKKLGINVDKLILAQMSQGESIFDLICKLLEAEPAIIVIDSVAALIPQDDLEKPTGDPVMATRARLMSRGLNKINTLNKSTLLLFINQLRTNIGMYGGPSTTTGGRALGFYSSVRVEVSSGTKDKLEDPQKNRIGQVVHFRVTKNKVGPPWREGYFKFYYDGTIDSIDELVSMALLNGKLQPNGPWYEFDGKKMMGREAFEEELRTNKEFYEKFKKTI